MESNGVALARCEHTQFSVWSGNTQKRISRDALRFLSPRAVCCAAKRYTLYVGWPLTPAQNVLMQSERQSYGHGHVVLSVSDACCAARTFLSKGGPRARFPSTPASPGPPFLDAAPAECLGRRAREAAEAHVSRVEVGGPAVGSRGGNEARRAVTCMSGGAMGHASQEEE